MDILAMAYESDGENENVEVELEDPSQIVYFPDGTAADAEPAANATDEEKLAKAMSVASTKSKALAPKKNDMEDTQQQKPVQKACPLPWKGPPPAKRAKLDGAARSTEKSKGPIIPRAWPQPPRSRIAPGPVPPPLPPPPPPPPPPAPAPVTPPKPSSSKKRPQEPSHPPASSWQPAPSALEEDPPAAAPHGGGWYTKMAVIISLWEREEWSQIDAKFKKQLGFAIFYKCKPVWLYV